MKKRILSMFLVLALLLTLVPTAFATEATTGFTDGTVQAPGTEGPIGLPVDTLDENEISGFAPASNSVNADEPKIVNGSDSRFSLTEAAQEPAADELVNFVVVMKQQPLLAAGYSVDEISAQSTAVTNYQNRQMATLDTLRTRLVNRFGSSEDFRINYTYTIATTGLSVTTEYGNKAAIEAMSGVEKVYVAPTFELPQDTVSNVLDELQPLTGNSSTMIGSDQLNQTGYTGKGMKIAILDTGIVVDHPLFAPLSEDKLTEDSMTKEDVEAVWDTLNASQTTLLNKAFYVSTKIPYAYNYFSKNFDVSHTGTAKHDHGTHVAGIAAGNAGVQEGVVGVAPDAQLIVMQVFSNSGGAPWDTIMAALEDCVRLDVDVANLSLGGAAGFTSANSEMERVLSLFLDTDIEVMIASGNDTNSAVGNLTGYDMALAGNPDIGMAGTPSTYNAAFAVASIDNDASNMLYFTVDGRDIGYTDSANSSATRFINNFKSKTLEFVAVPNFGEAADYANLNVEGKVALVSRGECSFPDKQAAAQAAGAVACVIYNNAPGHFGMIINDGGDNIPCISINDVDGQFLAKMGSGSLTVCDGTVKTFRSERTLSSFSSWGVTPDLKLKPEIAGVGGNVYSSTDPAISGSYYASWNGTSMATPQVTGAMAVLVEYMRANGYGFEDGELRRVATDLMMSTADPAFEGNLEYSPRGQGAGLVNLVEATSTQAYLSSRDTFENRPKGEMGDDPARTGSFSFGFEVNNFSADKTLTYEFDSSVLTETLVLDTFIGGTPTALDAKVEVYTVDRSDILKYDFNDDGQITTADARVLLRYVSGVDTIPAAHLAYTDVNGNGVTDKADVDVITAYCAELEVDADLLATVEYASESPVTSVTVAPGETVELTAKIQLTDADKAIVEKFPNGIYVEGFLYANDADEDGVDLSMPFVGFYGDWSDAPIFDDPDNASLYPRSVYTNYSQIGTNPYIRSGKSGDQYNAFSYANPLAEIDFGMLRNARKMNFTVTDKNTNEVYFDITGEYLTKSYYNASYGMVIPFYVLAEEGEVWNGMDKDGNKLPDGTQVTYAVQAWVDDGDDIPDDAFSFDLTLDDKAPQILNSGELQDALTFNEDGSINLTLEILENQNIAAVIFVNNEGIIMGKYEVDNTPGEAIKQTFDITGFGMEFTIVVGDYACNETEIDAVLDLGDHAANPVKKQLSKDRLYGCETFDQAVVEGGWFSANKADLSDPRNETFDSTNRFYSAEYVNGYLIAQSAVTGDLMLVTPSGSFWDAQTLVSQNGKKPGDEGCWVFYDMALDYSDKGSQVHDQNKIAAGTDTLYAVAWKYGGDQDHDGHDDGYNALYRVWFSKWNGEPYVEEVAAITGTQNNAEILTLACSTDGQLYGIDTAAKLYTIERDGVCTYVGTTDFVNELNYAGVNVIQSMGYDHNTETLYWYAHSQNANGMYYINVCMTYIVDPETGKCTEVGTYGPSGMTALFVPTDLESDLFTMGVDPTSVSLNPYSLTMAQGQTKRLHVNWQPWNAAPQAIEWISSDETKATVTQNGFVTAVGEGDVEIYAKTRVWDPYRYVDGQQSPDWVDKVAVCRLRVVGSNDGIYAYVISDYKNKDNDFTWLNFSDKAPTKVTQIAKAKTTVEDPMTGEIVTTDAIWQGGAYYNGYVYTMQVEPVVDETGSIAKASILYRSLVTKGETPETTVIGEPERIGGSIGPEIGNMGFDYNTGRMYGADLTNGGLAIIDLDTGLVDPLGEFSGDIGGAAIAPAMCVTKEGYIVVSDMFSNLYTVDPDTLNTTKLQGSKGVDAWYYAGMTYDYDTGNIYWNPCMSAGSSPLYLVRLEPNEWHPDQLQATIVDIGDVSTRSGVELTAMFTIPTEEPETKQIPVESIEITDGESVTGIEGGTMKLTAVTVPARPTVQLKTWTSDNTDVVTVDRYGNLSFVGVGTATVTVSISNKNPEDGGPFTDSIRVKVLESAGRLHAFLNSDEGGTGYYDMWMQFDDNDLRHASITDSMIAVYSLRAGEYYDGYYYCYNDKGEFYRIAADNHADFVTLGKLNLDLQTDQITDMAMDYTTGTMYGLTVSPYQSFGYLVTINLDNGQVTKVAQLDTAVYALAADKNGVLYAAGATNVVPEAKLYTLDKATAAATYVCDIPGAYAYTDTNYYGTMQYNPQLAYDITTDRLYLNATADSQYLSACAGMYLIQLNGEEAPEVVSLGGVSIYARAGSSIKKGDVYMSVLTCIPEADEIPAGKVNGIVMPKTAGRVAIGETLQIPATARPTNAANTALTYTTNDAAIATVDGNGLVTGVAAGTTTITVTSVENSDVTATFTVTVVDVSGPQSVAYTISANKDALVSFNPELPGATAEIVASVSGGTNVCGMAYGDDCLYYAVNGGGYPELFRYDFTTKQSTSMGWMECGTGCNGIAYDKENNIIYAGGGFYVYAFEVSKMQAGTTVSKGGNYFLDSDYLTVQDLAVVGDKVYYLGNDLYTSTTKVFCFDANTMTNRTLVVDDLQVNTVAGKTEMDYDSYRGLFYVTDAGGRLYSFDLEGNVTAIDTLPVGYDMNGLAIVPAKAE